MTTKKSSKKNLIKIGGGLLFILIFMISMYYKSWRIAWRIDGCLDAGGSFDDDTCQCDYQVNHPYKEKHQCK